MQYINSLHKMLNYTSLSVRIIGVNPGGVYGAPIRGLTPLNISLQVTLCIVNNIMDIYLK